MKRLIIDRTPECIRTALTVDGKLTELYIDPIGAVSQVGHIYLGRIQNLLPGQFAFVDIGPGKNVFVNLSRFHKYKKGDAILIQIFKDAYGAKGPYGGEQIRLKGRTVIVLSSRRGEIGVSRKITGDMERSRLRRAVYDALVPGYAAIIRTNAEGQPEEILAEETRNLIAQHLEIVRRARYINPPARLYPIEPETDADLLTDFISDNCDEVLEGTGLFEAHNLAPQIARALEKTLHLPCGGHISFEQTEACVVIDVNTGAFSGANNYRAAILQTNLEAAKSIAEQLLLRNYSGIIIIDFIDMKEAEDKRTLMEVLAIEIKKDRIRTEIVSMTELGLVLLTRRKTRPSLAQMLETPCPHCRGTGRVTGQTHTKTPI